MKRLLLIVLPIFLFFWSCEDEVEKVSIIGVWTLSEVCMFEDESCSGECSSEYTDSSGTYDLTELWIEVEGSLQITFIEDGSGTTSSDADFTWSGSGPYTVETENDDDVIFTLSDDMLTFNSIDDFCFQFTLTK